MSDGLTDSRDNNYERPAKNQIELGVEEMWEAIRAIYPDAYDVFWEEEGWHGIMIGHGDTEEFIHDGMEPFATEELAVRHAYSKLPSLPVERTQDEASLVDFAADPALGNPNSPGYFKSMDGLHPTNETYRRAAGSEEPKCDSVRDGLRCELEPDHIGSPGRPVFHHAVDSLGECQYWITPVAAPVAFAAPDVDVFNSWPELGEYGLPNEDLVRYRDYQALEAHVKQLEAKLRETTAPKRPELHWIRGSNYCKASEVDACIDYLEGRVRELELVGDALKEIYNNSGEVWLEKILRAAYPEWKSRWDILEAEPHE